jgi:bacillithiol biosynthesis cysteine-adding enzyme BshC
MKGVKNNIAYRDTGYFTPLILDYLEGNASLHPFYHFTPDREGLDKAIAGRSGFATDRKVLVAHLQEQYKSVLPSASVIRSIESLSDANTYTVCTAHQPALFTGTLYFIYKILHTIVLAKELSQRHPDKQFVPVYWMGSEDADLEELGNFRLGTEKIHWHTGQKGAVGKMKTKGLDALIRRIEGELGVLPFGKELIDLLSACYLKHGDIQTATFALVNELFGAHGLVVLIPDSASLKEKMRAVFEDDLFRQIPFHTVESSVASLSLHYKIQAHPRPINLFYMGEGIRNRIDRTTTGEFIVTDTDMRFSAEALRDELSMHPERFSPNVILRGLFQETILPNVAFIGGGGETAYWLELRSLFDHYKVPFPVLILRNSFILIPSAAKRKMQKLGLSDRDLFLSERELLDREALRDHPERLSIQQEMDQLNVVFAQLQEKAAATDVTLSTHVKALHKQESNRLQELAKKMLRAERKKNLSRQGQIRSVKESLFPMNGLQERVENFMSYYAMYGKAFIDLVLEHSATVEQQFAVIELSE